LLEIYKNKGQLLSQSPVFKTSQKRFFSKNETIENPFTPNDHEFKAKPRKNASKESACREDQDQSEMRKFIKSQLDLAIISIKNSSSSMQLGRQENSDIGFKSTYQPRPQGTDSNAIEFSITD